MHSAAAALILPRFSSPFSTTPLQIWAPFCFCFTTPSIWTPYPVNSRTRHPPLAWGRPTLWGVFNSPEIIDFPLEDEDVNPDVTPAPPPTKGRIDIIIDRNVIRRLDLSPASAVLRTYGYQIGDYTTPPSADPMMLFEQTIGFIINYERDDPLDPRELSEIPDIRLWFVCLDAAYPWLPVVLDWRGGELARYAAMLVPHQMSRRVGIVFNPEALELFAMKKLFTIYPWLKAQNVANPTTKLNDMMRMLGFSVDKKLYKLIE